MTWWARLLCTVLGWHKPLAGSGSFDGCSAHYTCARCARQGLIMDSQGNLF